MARTLIIDDPTSDDDGNALVWDHTRQVANATAVVKPTGGSMTGDLTFAEPVGVVLTASDDSQWRLIVGTDGALTTEEVV